jgi:hypothetical protein
MLIPKIALKISEKACCARFSPYSLSGLNHRAIPDYIWDGSFDQHPSRITERALSIISLEISGMLCSVRACSAAFRRKTRGLLGLGTKIEKEGVLKAGFLIDACRMCKEKTRAVSPGSS